MATLALIYKNDLFFTTKPLSLECPAQAVIATKHKKYLSSQVSYDTENVGSIQHDAGVKLAPCQLLLLSLDIVLPGTVPLAVRNFFLVFALTDDLHVRLLLVPSGNQMLLTLTVTHTP